MERKNKITEICELMKLECDQIMNASNENEVFDATDGFLYLVYLLLNAVDFDFGEDGGPGSGNWGHAGRPGKRGGSASWSSYGPAAKAKAKKEAASGGGGSESSKKTEEKKKTTAKKPALKKYNGSREPGEYDYDGTKLTVKVEGDPDGFHVVKYKMESSPDLEMEKSFGGGFTDRYRVVKAGSNGWGRYKPFKHEKFGLDWMREHSFKDMFDD